MAKKTWKAIVEPVVIVDVPMEQVMTDAGGSAETPEAEKVVAPKRDLTPADLESLTQSIRDGIASGNVQVSWDTVDVSAKKSPTGKAAYRYYLRIEARNAAGQSQVFGKLNAATSEKDIPADATADQRKALEAKGACDYANYGYDLERRAAARQALLGELEGPEKAVKKAVIGMLAIDMTPEEIRAQIMGSAKFKGFEGLANIVDSALQANA